MRFYRIGLCSLLCVLLCDCALAQALPQSLSLAEAIRLTLARSPLARGAEAHVQGANARLRGAGALSNPVLLIAPHVGSDTGGLDEDLLLSQTVELGDKRRQRVYSARAEREAALADRTQTTLDLTFNVQSAYYEALRAEAERRQAEEALTTARNFAQAAQTQFQAGDVAHSNVVRSRIEVARSTQTLAAATTERNNRYDTLRSLAGLPETANLNLTDPLAFAAVGYRLSDLQTLALRNRPDLQSDRRLRDAREADLHGARVASQPDLILEGRHRTLSPTDQGSSLRFGLQFPLVDYGKNRADSVVAKSALLAQQAVLDEGLRTAQLEVRASHRNLEQARQAVESFQSGRLDSAKELLQMAQTGYDHGANSYLELLDAQQVYRSEQVEYARALAAYNEAKAALQRAVGGTLP